jgi:hypothetical protein
MKVREQITMHFSQIIGVRIVYGTGRRYLIHLQNLDKFKALIQALPLNTKFLDLDISAMALINNSPYVWLSYKFLYSTKRGKHLYERFRLHKRRFPKSQPLTEAQADQLIERGATMPPGLDVEQDQATATTARVETVEGDGNGGSKADGKGNSVGIGAESTLPAPISDNCKSATSAAIDTLAGIASTTSVAAVTTSTLGSASTSTSTSTSTLGSTSTLTSPSACNQQNRPKFKLSSSDESCKFSETITTFVTCVIARLDNAKPFTYLVHFVACQKFVDFVKHLVESGSDGDTYNPDERDIIRQLKALYHSNGVRVEHSIYLWMRAEYLRTTKHGRTVAMRFWRVTKKTGYVPIFSMAEAAERLIANHVTYTPTSPPEVCESIHDGAQAEPNTHTLSLSVSVSLSVFVNLPIQTMSPSESNSDSDNELGDGGNRWRSKTKVQQSFVVAAAFFAKGTNTPSLFLSYTSMHLVQQSASTTALSDTPTESENDTASESEEDADNSQMDVDK